MDVSFQPKSTQPEDVKRGPTFADIAAMYKGEKKSILVIILTITLIPIVLAIGGIYMYKQSLQSRIAQKEQELQAKDAQMPIKPADMSEMAKLSNRIKIVSEVVKGHPFMTTFLKLLEYSVEDDVVFKKASLAAGSTGGREVYNVSLDVQAKSYSAVLNQVQTLRDQSPYNKFFSNIEMQGFAVDKKGSITFKISGLATVKGLTPEEAERELLKVLSASELPPREAFEATTETSSGTSTSTTP
jgi:hypothetical protein